MAYCANPSARTPEGGSYSKHAPSAPSGRTAETAADLWFGYGGACGCCCLAAGQEDAVFFGGGL